MNKPLLQGWLIAITLLLSAQSLADGYQTLYQAAGWVEQRSHFREALAVAQQRYKNTLPSALYEALVNNSSQRFAVAAIDARALQSLRSGLPDPQAALAFYQSALGRKIVTAEVRASSREQLARYANGLPSISAGTTRQLLIRHLSQSLPVSAVGAEVSLALAGVAADSLTQMMPGLLSTGQAQGLLNNQRQRLIERFDGDMDATLLHVYQGLSDAELDEYLMFVQSAAGKAYYQAALQAVRAGLAVGQDMAAR